MIVSRPVTPRASRTALIVASVPELTMRTMSTDATASVTIRASSTSRAVGAPKLVPRSSTSPIARITAGCRCPKIIGPQEPM